jgi:hypothetical protein
LLTYYVTMTSDLAGKALDRPSHLINLATITFITQEGSQGLWETRADLKTTTPKEDQKGEPRESARSVYIYMPGNLA